MSVIDQLYAERQTLADVSNRQTAARRGAEQGQGQAVIAELEQSHSDLLAQRNAAYGALHSAAADLQDATHRARQHAATPPTDRDAVVVWVKRRTDLQGEIEAFTALHQQAEAAYRQAEQALRTTIARAVQQRYRAMQLAYNERLREVQTEHAERMRQLQAWATEQGDALQRFVDEQIAPVYQAGQLLGVGLPLSRDANHAFRID